MLPRPPSVLAADAALLMCTCHSRPPPRPRAHTPGGCQPWRTPAHPRPSSGHGPALVPADATAPCRCGAGCRGAWNRGGRHCLCVLPRVCVRCRGVRGAGAHFHTATAKPTRSESLLPAPRLLWLEGSWGPDLGHALACLGCLPGQGWGCPAGSRGGGRPSLTRTSWPTVLSGTNI